MKLRRRKKQKKKLYVLILFLLTLSIGMGYAILSEKLNVNGIVGYSTIKWDVGFETAIDGGGTVVTTPTISSDKKNIIISCDIGTSTASETCIVKTTIKNDSTYEIKLNGKPTIEYDRTYVDSVELVWVDDSNFVNENDIINYGSSREMLITITTKELTKETIPVTSLEVPVTLTMNWVEGENSISE